MTARSPSRPDPAAAPAGTPAALGFRMPPERAPHAATWTGWPFDDELWEGQLSAARDDVAALVTAVARFEPVVLNVRDDEAEADARERLARSGARLDRIALHRLPQNDIWFRDCGPLFVVDAEGRVAITDWEFNGWGGKYEWRTDTLAPKRVADRLGARRFATPVVMEGGALEISGEGVCLTTRQCLLNQNRNPNLSESELERVLHDWLGVRHVVWLGEGLEGDHTDGHIDTITRFADDRTIVTSVEPDEDDPNHAPLARNLTLLRTLRSPDGRPYRIVELPLPRERRELGGRRLPQTYANFYVGNGFVAVPQYGDPHDARALETLRPLFPEREVLGLPAAALITGGGSFHCITQQQPAGALAPAQEDA